MVPVPGPGRPLAWAITAALAMVLPGGVARATDVCVDPSWAYTDGCRVEAGKGDPPVVTVTAANAADWAVDGDLYILNSTLDIHGDGAKVSTRTLYSGRFSTGYLKISDGGVLDADSAYLASSGATTEVTISGTGSALNVAKDMVIGSDYSTGFLTIADGATVKAGKVTVGVPSDSGTPYGAIYIGAKSDAAAAAPGTLDTAALELGSAGELYFNHTDASGDYVFAPAVSGSGSIQLLNGTTTFTGASSSFAGATEVRTGATLLLGGSDATLDGTVHALGGGTLAGNGSFGTTTVDADATLSPGNAKTPIGTLNIAGDLTLAGNARYAVDIAGDGRSDQTAVTGSAELQGGTVKVTALDPSTSYRNGQTYAILDAKGGVTGTFAEATTDSAFLTTTLAYSTNTVTLNIATANASTPTPEPTPEPEPKPLFTTAATTPNQYAVAHALDGLAQSGPALALYNTLLLQNATRARNAFDQLSGQIHAAARSAIIDASRHVRSLVNQHLLAVADDDAAGIQAWATGMGYYDVRDADRNADRVKSQHAGVIAGADYQFEHGPRAGVLVGNSVTSISNKVLDADAHARATEWGAYAAIALPGEFQLRGGGFGANQNIRINRVIRFGDFQDSPHAAYDGRLLHGYVELGRGFDWKSVQLEPFLNLARAALKTHTLQEQGGAAALRGKSTHTLINYATVGLHGSFTDAARAFSLYGTLAWQRAWGEREDGNHLQFSGSATPFLASSVPLARNSGSIEVGIRHAFTDAITWSLGYASRFGGTGVKEHGGDLHLDWKF